jgi:cytochrome c553
MKSPAHLSSSLVLTLVLAVFSATPALAAEPAAAAKPDLAAGATASIVCQACHIADGSRGIPVNPILQGQFPEYLSKQLHEFKAGKRMNPIMQGMAAPLTEENIRDITAFYATKKAVPGAARNKDSVMLGQKIWRAGVADRKIPACAGCHGPSGAGIPSQFPRVGGQNPDYAESQLIAFRSGMRTNSAQMTGVAAKLNDAEIKAVADYMAGLN